MSAQIYFVRGTSTLTKIGYSRNIELRMSHLRWKEKDNAIEVLHLIPCEDQAPHFLEAAFHFRFLNKHSHGEWFALSPDDIFWIKSIKHGNQLDATELIKRWHIEGRSSNISRAKWIMYKEGSHEPVSLL